MLGRFCWRGLILLALLSSVTSCGLLEPEITTSLLPDGIVGQPYSATVTVANPISGERWSASGLPAGLSINRSTGVISGTPTEAGTFNVEVDVDDAFGNDYELYTIHIADPLTITTATLANGTEGVAYDQTVTTSGGLEPLSFRVSSGALPGGLALNTTTGNITGTPTSGGSFTFTIEVTDFLNRHHFTGSPQTASEDYTVLILQITTTSLPDGIENQAYGPETLGVTGQVDPVTWGAPPESLPPRLNLNAETGEISGMPTAAGTYNFTVQATDSDSPPRTDTQDVSIDIVPQLTITTAELPNATEGAAYDEPIQAAGGTAPYVWSEPTESFDAAGVGASSTPCEGLTFDVNATGLSASVSGTPVNVDTCGPFTARVEDSGVPPQSAEQSLSINVAAAPSPAGVLGRVSVATDGTEGNDASFDATINADGRYVAFGSSASTLVAGDTNGVDDVFVRDTCVGAAGCTPATTRVSLANDGSQGSSHSFVPSITPDGRFVAFGAEDGNFAAGDNNSNDDIFVRDTCLGAVGCVPSTVIVSVDNGGLLDNGRNDEASISASGRYVAFYSSATNLVANDTNARLDVFLHDRDTDNDGLFDEPDLTATTRVSVASDGSEADRDAWNSSSATSISADGRYVVFYSSATTLVAGDTNGVDDVFVRDTCAGAAGCTPSTVRVSVANDGSQANGISDVPSISADGRFVAFRSRASNLVAGDTNGFADIFVRDTCVGAAGCTPSTVRVSVASDGSEGNQAGSLLSISADGRFVAFASFASNLVAGDNNAVSDIFVHDRDTDNDGLFDEPGAIATVRVSVGPGGVEGNGQSTDPVISADGHYVVFVSNAGNLVVGDSNGASDVFIAATGF
jgi:Tol biopolymer transport system component